MQETRPSASRLKTGLLLGAVCALVLLGLWLLYQYDNKYTAKAPLTQDGSALASSGSLSFLVDGWTLYPDQLLTPEDFTSNLNPGPGYRTWLGQYPNLSAFHADGDPCGVATYRLRLKGQGALSLFLPEVLCAQRVYIGGQLAGEWGNVSESGYRPLIRDAVYPLTLDGELELVIQTANFSHYYGGLYYPPAVGSPSAILGMVAPRMVLYGLLCFSTLALALFCLVLWRSGRGRRDPLAFYFGLLCLSFALRVSYPFFRMVGVPLVRALYAVEDTAALLGIYCAVRIILLLCFPEGFPRLRATAATVSLGLCWTGAAVPLAVLPFFPAFAGPYGALISWYKLLAAAFLVFGALWGTLRGTGHSRWLLAGVTAYGVCLFAATFAMDRFEPIVGAWQDEYGSFLMVGLFGVMMVRRSRDMAVENLRLTEHLQEEVDAKTQYLTKLVEERKELMSGLLHDVKSPLTSLLNFTHIVQSNDILLDAETHTRMQVIKDKCTALSDRVQSLQSLVSEEEQPTTLRPLSLNQLLSDFYRDNKPVIELSGPDLTLKLPAQEYVVMADQEKFQRVLENIVYNAEDFTPPAGEISLALDSDGISAYLHISDTGCGIPAEQLDQVFDRFFTSRPDQGGHGLGLSIAKSIVTEHGGTISVISELGVGSSFTICLPLCQAQ